MLTFFQHGITPSDIKAAIIETLDPYFSNKQNLEDYAIKYLVSGWINFMLFRRNGWYFGKFEKCLDLFNEAKARAPEACFEAVALWLPEINRAVTKYWSFSNLEQDKDSLGLEEFLEENLKIIGQMLEAVAKPYFKLLLHINRIRRGDIASFAQIDQLKLGSLIDELIVASGIQELFKPPPWEIRLNQWRNIAYHHTAEIDNERIICWYIQNRDKKKFL
jgi:hypothetical protein